MPSSDDDIGVTLGYLQASLDIPEGDEVPDSVIETVADLHRVSEERVRKIPPQRSWKPGRPDAATATPTSRQPRRTDK